MQLSGMTNRFIEQVSGFAQLRALSYDLRQTDDCANRRRALLQRLAAVTLTRPTALIEACHATKLHERDIRLAHELCRHALNHAEGEAERSAVLAYGHDIGLELTDAALHPPASKTAYLTPAQRRALTRLRVMAELFFEGAPAGPMAPRLIPLIMGPSGVGKNHIVRTLARELDCPVLRLTVGDWVVQGARKQCTFERLRDFITPLRRAVLHLDELDKFRAHNDAWSLAIFGELFSILDRDVGVSTDEKPWTEEHAQKLRRSVFIVASGTWQEAWKSTRRMGFSATADVSDASPAIRTSDLVSPELLNRFNDRWIRLEPYGAEDFRAIIAELRLPKNLIDPAVAAASGLNYRYLENAYTEHLLARHALEQPFPRPNS